jgi:hypothetical protein
MNTITHSNFKNLFSNFRHYLLEDYSDYKEAESKYHNAKEDNLKLKKYSKAILRLSRLIPKDNFLYTGLKSDIERFKDKTKEQDKTLYDLKRLYVLSHKKFDLTWKITEKMINTPELVNRSISKYREKGIYIIHGVLHGKSTAALNNKVSHGTQVNLIENCERCFNTKNIVVSGNFFDSNRAQNMTWSRYGIVIKEGYVLGSSTCSQVIERNDGKTMRTNIMFGLDFYARANHDKEICIEIKSIDGLFINLNKDDNLNNNNEKLKFIEYVKNKNLNLYLINEDNIKQISLDEFQKILFN